MRYLPLILLLAACRTSIADSTSKPVPIVTVSSSARCFFAMLPAHWHGQPSGTAYQLQDNGSFRELWRVRGWYAFSCFLSDDGRYLVRMGDWPVGDEPSKKDLAVAFYDRGKLLGQFSTADLVKDKTKVRVSTSHYAWLANQAAMFEKHPEPPPRLDYDNKFHLKTVDGIEYTFDATTGKITKPKGE